MQPPQPLDVRRERPCDLLALGLGRPLAERPRVARQLLPQRGQRAARRPGRRTAPRRRRGTRSRPCPPRATAAGARRDRGSSPPTRARRPPSRSALEVPGRVGEAVRVVDPQPVHDALGDERERQPVRLGEHLRVLLAHAGEVVDLEEAPVAAGLRVEVEERPPALGVGPVRVRVVRRHVVRDDVQHDARGPPRAPPRRAPGSRPRRRARPRSASGRHVVAVRRALARGERRREVEVGDAEVAQVRARAPRASANVRSSPSCRRYVARNAAHVTRARRSERERARDHASASPCHW